MHSGRRAGGTLADLGQRLPHDTVGVATQRGRRSLGVIDLHGEVDAGTGPGPLSDPSLVLMEPLVGFGAGG